MKNNKFIMSGMLAVLLAFGLVFSSCGTDENNDTVATPTANPKAGAYSATQTVTLYPAVLPIPVDSHTALSGHKIYS
jgi:hypothetical protein